MNYGSSGDVRRQREEEEEDGCDSLEIDVVSGGGGGEGEVCGGWWRRKNNDKAKERLASAGLFVVWCSVVAYVIGRASTKTTLAAQQSALQQESDAIISAAEEAEETLISSSSSLLPNVIVIVVDDQGFNDIGYNSEDLTDVTPNMDALAAEGTKFTRFYTQPICTPARAALMTSKYPVRLGMQHGQIMPMQPWGLPTNEKIMPEVLQELGYNTQGIGKWHLGFHDEAMLPTNRGFDGFFGYLTGGNDYFTHRCYVSDETSEEDEDGGYSLSATETTEAYFDLWSDGDFAPNYDDGTYDTYLFADKVENVITDHVDAHGDDDTPLFLYYSMQAVHAPLDVPESVYTDRDDVLGGIVNNDRRVFAAMTLLMDDAVGSLVAQLKESGLYENSVIVCLSDNGGNVLEGGSNYPLRGNKKYLYEGGIRVNAFVHSPLLGTAAKGTEYSNLMHISDVMPTLWAGALGQELSTLGDIDGISHHDYLFLDGSSTAPRDELLVNTDYLDMTTVEIKELPDYIRGSLIASHYNGALMKLVYNEENVPSYPIPTHPDEVLDWSPTNVPFTSLYNLDDDPSELEDLKDDPSFLGVFNSMVNRLLDLNDQIAIDSLYSTDDEACVDAWDLNIGRDGTTKYVSPWTSPDTSS